MSKRSIRKRRHRADFSEGDTFRERCAAGQLARKMRGAVKRPGVGAKGLGQ